jgi:homoserine kinase
LLVAAFAQNRGDLLRTAMVDRIHQPYRSEACPLLPLLLPLSEHPGVLGVALSGAGPSVLLVIERETAAAIRAAIRERAGDIEVIEIGASKGTIILVT